VAAEKGLLNWTPGAPKLYSLPDPIGSTLQVLTEDSSGALLIGMRDGIEQLVDGRIQAFPVPAARQQVRLRALLRDRNGSLWLGTERGLLHIHQGQMDVFGQSDGLSNDDIVRLFEDREGNIWVTTKDGLDRFREFVASTFSAKQGLAGDYVSSVLSARNGDVWLNTDGGLNRWNNGQITAYRERRGSTGPKSPLRTGQPSAVREVVGTGLPERGLSSIYQDHRGRMWFGTNQGIGYLESDRFVSIRGLPGGLVNSITEDTRGNLWIVNQNLGLFRLSTSDEIQQIPWARLGRDDPVFRIVADPLQGGLWLGFSLGGVAYLADGQIRASYAATDGLGEGRVNDLRVDRDGTLWASTEGGLSRLKNGRVNTITSSSGLPCDSVEWMLDEEDWFWLYTVCGLVRIARSELDGWTAAVDKNEKVKPTIQSVVFDSSDGIRSAANGVSTYSPHFAKSADGKLWFAGYDGVSVVDPRRLPFNALPPPVHIEQIIADHKPCDVTFGAGPCLRLPSLSHDLEIDYTALSFVAPEKVRFRFKLEGYDRDWQDAGNRRQAFYTNLPPRNYRFRVTASNNSGVWNEAGTFLDFSVAPAYYQTDWFRLLIVAAILASLAALYRLRQRQMARQFNIRLEERVRERTRIARDLHDTMLQSFQGVLLRFHTVTYLLPDRPDEARNTLESVIEQAREAITEGRDAVQGLRSLPAINDLARAIRTLGEEIAAHQAVENRPDFSVNVEGAPRELAAFPRDETYRIAIEAVRNAFRHGNAKRIEVEIHYGQRQLRLRVRDNGKGIDPKLLSGHGMDGHYGLTGMHERAKSVGGNLAVWSERDSGTEAELTIPASIAYAKSPAASREASSGKGT